MGIEPTKDGVRLSKGFEDLGGHQYPIQLQTNQPSLYTDF